MAYGIGIDTGGTYTDAVVYDFDTRTVLAKGKSPTTRQDLALGIGRALDMLPADLLSKADFVALSTTLATNACVEDKGGRARLVMIGTDKKTLEWVEADKKYGLNFDEVLCLKTQGSYDGQVVQHPDWENVMAEQDAFFQEAQALSVAEVNAMRNGAVCEIMARDQLRKKYDVPFVMASELVSGLNVMERGATALLNARLLPVIDQFMKAIDRALKGRGLNVQQVIVRSDGSMMSDAAAKMRPVETVLSGPAASVMGSRALANSKDCLIVDMGGTTTDISIVRDGAPCMTGGIRIGSWRTQIKGVYIDTFGLGGDTRIYMKEGKLCLDTRRVEPLCAAAVKWPVIKDELEKFLPVSRMHTRALHEFLYLVQKPASLDRFTENERLLIRLLEDGPQMLGGEALNLYDLDSTRLEKEGVVMRCGLTPTDIMHIRGDYDIFDREASVLGGRCFVRALPYYYKDNEENLRSLCDEVYDLVKRRLYENIVRVFLENTYPDVFGNGLDRQMQDWIARQWDSRHEKQAQPFFELQMIAAAALVGVGAPTHIFLPDVAAALGIQCIIPEHSEVANAVGAVVADVKAEAAVEVRVNYVPDTEGNYTVHGEEKNTHFIHYIDALEAATQEAKDMAIREARRRGALGELFVQVDVREDRGQAKDGTQIELGTMVVATASGRMQG